MDAKTLLSRAHSEAYEWDEMISRLDSAGRNFFVELSDKKRTYFALDCLLRADVQSVGRLLKHDPSPEGSRQIIQTCSDADLHRKRDEVLAQSSVEHLRLIEAHWGIKSFTDATRQQAIIAMLKAGRQEALLYMVTAASEASVRCAVRNCCSAARHLFACDKDTISTLLGIISYADFVTPMGDLCDKCGKAHLVSQVIDTEAKEDANCWEHITPTAVKALLLHGISDTNYFPGMLRAAFSLSLRSQDACLKFICDHLRVHPPHHSIASKRHYVAGLAAFCPDAQIVEKIFQTLPQSGRALCDDASLWFHADFPQGNLKFITHNYALVRLAKDSIDGRDWAAARLILTHLKKNAFNVGKMLRDIGVLRDALRDCDLAKLSFLSKYMSAAEDLEELGWEICNSPKMESIFACLHNDFKVPAAKFATGKFKLLKLCVKTEDAAAIEYLLELYGWKGNKYPPLKPDESVKHLLE